MSEKGFLIILLAPAMESALAIEKNDCFCAFSCVAEKAFLFIATSQPLRAFFLSSAVFARFLR